MMIRRVRANIAPLLEPQLQQEEYKNNRESNDWTRN
jgi:hypothetical protein